MEEKISAIKDFYTKNLKALEYAEFANSIFQEDPHVFKVTMQFYKNVLESGRFKGSKVLEIGSGPLVHNIASASALPSPNIVMSDYVEDNCEELKRWLRGHHSPIRQILDVTAELEGFKGNLEHGKQVLETRIRKAVKQVVRCDILCDDVFLEELKPEVAPPYDLIISSSCLEASVPDLEGFSLALKRINKLLRPGGGLLLMGFSRAKEWTCANIAYHHIDATVEDVTKALAESGFGNIDLQTDDKFGHWYEYDKHYCLAAEKL